MGTLRIPILEDAKTIPPKRRAVGFYFGCGQCKDDVVPAGVERIEEDEPADSLPDPAIRDDDSPSAEVVVPISQCPDADLHGCGLPAVDEDDDDAEGTRDESQDTIDYTLPAGFPFHEGNSDEEG